MVYINEITISFRLRDPNTTNIILLFISLTQNLANGHLEHIITSDFIQTNMVVPSLAYDRLLPSIVKFFLVVRKVTGVIYRNIKIDVVCSFMVIISYEI